MAIIKDYAVVRYYRSGFRSEIIQQGLTLDEALAICRANNLVKGEGEILPRLWLDCAQRTVTK